MPRTIYYTSDGEEYEDYDAAYQAEFESITDDELLEFIGDRFSAEAIIKALDDDFLCEAAEILMMESNHFIKEEEEYDDEEDEEDE